MAYRAVIGFGFGDEGKGLFTDYLCAHSEAPLVIRFSGGQQAGHTVASSGIRHVFSNFGAGTLRNAPSYFAPFCTIDPIAIVNELTVLLHKGVKPQLYIDVDCPVTTPYDVLYNRMNNHHGSCGVGVGATLLREERFYSLTYGDLFYPWVLGTKLELIAGYYPNLRGVALSRFMECCDIITHCEYIHKASHIPSGPFSDYIFEGSQGLLLDARYGFFPHVTRGNTGSQNILKLLGGKTFSCYLVTRAYQTRHGLGPMSNENLPHNISENPEETNQSNDFQGPFRRTLLDVSLLEYALQKDAYIANCADKHLVITCLDHIKNEYRFTYRGELVYCRNEDEFVEQISGLLNIRHIYLSASCESRQIREFKAGAHCSCLT
ncbi:MAG: adenylosuccinate synthetase [Gammaproteobacteria bacterium]